MNFAVVDVMKMERWQLCQLTVVSDFQVNIVDPLKLTQEFSTILADQIIATNVVATCHLHKRL